MNLLFLGAGKRFTLIERFIEAAQKETAELNIFSIESSLRVPISRLATIIVGPHFLDRTFPDCLLETVIRQKIGLAIPHMDTATVALSRIKDRLAQLGCHAVVSTPALCEAMEDKVLAENWFSVQGLPIPRKTRFPSIVKNRRGFGSRDQTVVRDERELRLFFQKRKREDYIVQEFIRGQEYTVDAYVDRAGRMVTAVSRKRLEVRDGEVDVSEIKRHPLILELTSKILAVPGWEGPITLQFIDRGDDSVLIEINPRFGGGATHSIYVGFDMPRWILREQMKRPIKSPKECPDGSIMMRYRNDVFI